MFWPLIVRTALRGVTEAAFDWIVTPIVLLPVPPAVLSWAHGESLDAVHAQFARFVLMPITPVPPVDPNGEPRRDVSNVTEHATPSCVIWNGCPPIVSVPI